MLNFTAHNMSYESTSGAEFLHNMDLDKHCGFRDQDYDKCETIRLVKTWIFSFTITMDVVALIVLILYRKYQSFSQRIFLNILLSNLVEGIAHQLDKGEAGIKCTIAAFLVQTSGFALFMWVCALTLFLFLLLIKKTDSRRYENWYNFVCWGIPLITGIIPFLYVTEETGLNGASVSTQQYGPAGAFCWVVLDPLRFAIWWVPVPCGMLLILLAFIIMICKATRGSFTDVSDAFQRKQKRLISNYLWPLTGYGVTFVVLHSIMLAERISTYGNQYPIFEMKLLHIISISFYGSILCTLFYVTNGRKGLSRQKLREALAAHHYFLMGGCQKSRKAVVKTMSVKPESYSDTDSEAEAEPQPSFADQVELSARVAVISGPIIGETSAKQLSIEIKSDSKSKVKSKKNKNGVKSTLKVPKPKRSRESLSLTIRSISEAKYLDPRHLKSHRVKTPAVTNFPSLSLSSIVFEPKQASERESVGVLDETIIDKPQSEITEQSMRETTKDQNSDSQGLSLNLQTNISYVMERMSEMPKIYLIEDCKSRWEVWRDNQTLESWVLGIQKSLQRTLTVMVHDRDGAYFGEQVTWGQIKSCSDSIRIVINGGVTEIEFTPALEDEGNRSLAKGHPTMYVTDSCV